MIKSISDKIMVLLSLMALVGVVGCSSETFKSSDNTTDDDYESILPDSDDSDDAISFSTLVWSDDDTKSTATRGTITEDFVVDDDIGVYAYRLPSDGSVDALTVSPNFMHNQQVTKQSDGSWFYTPTKYWSNDATDEYLFFGYAPYSEGEENTMYHSSINNTITYPVIVHTSPTEMKDSRDLVLAGRKCTKYDEKGDFTTVDLTFKHVLSRLRFEFRNDLMSDEETYSMVVKSIKLVNVTTQSAFTYEDDPDPNSETGLLLVEYLADEVQQVGTISGSIESGALIGAGDDENGYSSDAYIPYYAYGHHNYQTYTPITPDDEYLFLDPYIIGDSKVMFEIEVEVYANDTNSDSGWALAVTNTSYVEVSEMIKGTTVTDNEGIETTSGGMSRGGSYVWQISYKLIPGSGLIVYVIEYWDDVYNKHDM